VVLGLIFLKYISDAFQERYEQLQQEEYADPEDRDEYTGENVFWVPPEARWGHLQAESFAPAAPWGKQSTIGKVIDDAMVAIERENPKRLKGVFLQGLAKGSIDGLDG